MPTKTDKSGSAGFRNIIILVNHLSDPVNFTSNIAVMCTMHWNATTLQMEHENKNILTGTTLDKRSPIAIKWSYHATK